MKHRWTICRKMFVAFMGMAGITLVLGLQGYYGAVKGLANVTEVGGCGCQVFKSFY